jgi:hypothetical protein
MGNTESTSPPPAAPQGPEDAKLNEMITRIRMNEPSFRVVRIRGSAKSIGGFAPLAEAFKLNNSIQHLELVHMGIGPEDARILIPALKVPKFSVVEVVVVVVGRPMTRFARTYTLLPTLPAGPRTTKDS